MIEKYCEVYEENKKLDKIFIDKYDHDDFVRKNKLELLVEIGELANESRCFKYWSKKEVNKELVGYELADTIIMSLCFLNYLKINLDEISFSKSNKDVIDLFFEVYDLVIKFSYEEEKETIIKIFVSLLNIGYQLGFTDDDIIGFCHSKIVKNMGRI